MEGRCLDQAACAKAIQTLNSSGWFQFLSLTFVQALWGFTGVLMVFYIPLSQKYSRCQKYPKIIVHYSSL